MENKKLGQEPAFPICDSTNWGMSKRFYAACAAMQGMIAGGYVSLTNGMIAPNLLVKKAYEISDELLKQENL